MFRDELEKLRSRGCAIVLLALPVQFILLVLAMLLLGGLVAVFPTMHTFFAELGFQSKTLEFLEVWNLGIMIYVLNVISYTIFEQVKKIKLRYDLLCTLVISSVFLVIFRILFPPRGLGHFFPDLGLYIVKAYVSATILFATFTRLSILLDKFTQKEEWVKRLSAFVIAMIFGGIFSYLIWMLLL